MINTQHDQTQSPEAKVHAWLLNLSAGLFFWVVAGTFLVALVW